MDFKLKSEHEERHKLGESEHGTPFGLCVQITLMTPGNNDAGHRKKQLFHIISSKVSVLFDITS